MSGSVFSNLSETLKWHSGRLLSPVSVAILIVGLLTATIVTAFFYFTSRDLRVDMAHSLAQDLFRHRLENTVKSMHSVYMPLATDPSATYAKILPSHIDRILSQSGQIEGVLWASSYGAWHMQEFKSRTVRTSFDGSVGWPSFENLQDVVARHDDGDIVYLNDMQWPAFKNMTGSASKAPFGLVMKVGGSGARSGILFVVTSAESLFGYNWQNEHRDIARITVQDRDTGTIIFDTRNKFALEDKDYQSVKGNLQLGGKMWDVHFDALLPEAAGVMRLAPFFAFNIILLLALAAVFLIERGNYHKMQLTGMVKSLDDARHDLQSSMSERDHLLHSLRKAERENKALINAVSDVIFETDDVGKILYMNETWKRMTGVEVQDVVGRQLFSLVDAEDRMHQRDMFGELIRGERAIYRVETTLDLNLQGKKPVEISFSMLRMGEDKSLRVVGTITDIEKKRKAEMALREAEYRYRAMFENATNGIYQSSVDGRYLNVNPAMAEILGYATPSDLIDTINNITVQLYVRPEESKVFDQKMMFEGRVTNMEIEVYRKDGSKIWIMENARVVRDDKGAILYYEGSVTDITERKKAESAMYNARLQAEMSSRSRMEFLANMSHELRTPLNAIIGFSEIIKDEVMGEIGTPSYKEYAKDIYESGNYLLKVISEILEVSRIETGNRELNVSTFRISKALKSCMTIMSGRIDESGVECKISIPDTLPEVMAEELGFKQIMLNLIGNAIKFTEKGGKVDVVSYLLPTGEMAIDVRDTGIGMTADEVTKAMQPFSKVDNNFSTMKAGTGLGLTIVDSLVRLHGGRFELLSEKGKGTTARVIMPAYRVFRPDIQEQARGSLKVIK